MAVTLFEVKLIQGMIVSQDRHNWNPGDLNPNGEPSNDFAPGQVGKSGEWIAWGIRSDSDMESRALELYDQDQSVRRFHMVT
jgi:hypothetical protein